MVVQATTRDVVLVLGLVPAQELVQVQAQAPVPEQVLALAQAPVQVQPRRRAGARITRG